MGDEERESQNTGFSWHYISFVLIALILLLFAPLILSLIEYFIFGTHHIEGFFRDIGVHGFLKSVYKPIVNFIKNVF